MDTSSKGKNAGHAGPRHAKEEACYRRDGVIFHNTELSTQKRGLHQASQATRICVNFMAVTVYRMVVKWCTHDLTGGLARLHANLKEDGADWLMIFRLCHFVQYVQ